MEVVVMHMLGYQGGEHPTKEHLDHRTVHGFLAVTLTWSAWAP